MLDYCVMSKVRYTEIRALNGIHTHLMGLVSQTLSCKLGHLLWTWDPREGSFRNVWVGMCCWDTRTLSLYQTYRSSAGFCPDSLSHRNAIFQKLLRSTLSFLLN